MLSKREMLELAPVTHEIREGRVHKLIFDVVYVAVVATPARPRSARDRAEALKALLARGLVDTSSGVAARSTRHTRPSTARKNAKTKRSAS